MTTKRDYAAIGRNDKRVCHACIDEPQLKVEIKRSGQPARCAYCDGTNLRTVTVTGLARRIDDVYRRMVRFADECAHFSFDGGATWEARGETPGALIADLIVAGDEGIAEDIVEQLGEDHAFNIHRDGDTDWYDLGNETYEIEEPIDPQFHHAWTNFCQSVKHVRRFFSEDATAVLDMLLGPLLEGRRRLFRGAIQTIGPADEGRFLYRARKANEDGDRKKIYSAPISELGAPPAALATAGRMNPAGISVFYACRDIETAVAELRVPVAGCAIVGRFEIIRPLRLLDLTKLEAIENDLSPFHPDYFEVGSFVQFLQGFHAEIRKPVIPGRERLEYLPTQVVAEYLWTRSENAVDGIIFRSAQVSDDRENIVLFPRSCSVEGADAEVRREVPSLFLYADQDDEDVVEMVFRKREEAKVKDPADDLLPDDDWLSPFDRKTEDPPAAALRFDPGTLVNASVKGIRYDLDETAVEFHDHRPDVF